MERAGAGAQRRSQQQNCQAAEERLKFPSAKGLSHCPGAEGWANSTAAAGCCQRPPVLCRGESLKHHSQHPPVRSPTKPLILGKPQGTTNLKSRPNPGVALPWPRPMVKEAMGRKDMKVVPPGHTASRGRGHPNQSHTIQNTKTHVAEDDVRSRRDQLPKASGMEPRRVPRTQAGADRRKQLEEWVAAKGKKYKRPPMWTLQKQTVMLPCRMAKAEEEQENPEQHCKAKISYTLTECPKLIEEGVHTEEHSAVLSLVPQAEIFVKFYICWATLLAQSVLQLYKEAAIAGAEPVEELRETALNISKEGDQKLEGEKVEQPFPREPRTPCPGERQPIESTPDLVGRPMTSLPPSVKLSVTSASRKRKFLKHQGLTFITPVRRSLRIERAMSRYPDMLKDHDPVVSSLRELFDAEKETCFILRKNIALPEVSEVEGFEFHLPSTGHAACPL